MQVDSVEIYNFRRLHKATLDFSSAQTLLVGANNSGKTFAMVALRAFLKGRCGLSVKDLRLPIGRHLKRQQMTGWVKRKVALKMTLQLSLDCHF